MPTVNLFKCELDSKIGQLTEDEFREICFQFGLELDEVTSEYEMVAKEQGTTKAVNCSQDVIFKVEVPANRHDLLCVEGLTRAIMIFQDKMNSPRYVCSPKMAAVKMTVKAATQRVRPFAVAAILRGIKFTKERYDSFISLQDKLHQNIGRKRSVVSIGTHDLDTVTPPFIYDARPPCDISFVPLNENRPFTAEQLMTHYSGESHLRHYLPIIRDYDVYPVICDARGAVLSLPPIINGHQSRITLSTTNVFIEITATNLHKASVTLDTIVTMFSEYCSSPFQVEPVEIVWPDGSCHQYPELPYRQESVSVDYINRMVGISINGDEMASLLAKMGLRAEVTGSVLAVEIGPTRHDMLHRCDIVEDVAIAYGFDNIPEPTTYSGTYPDGGLQPLTKLTNALRLEMVKNSFTEVLTFALCSREDISAHLNMSLDTSNAVHVANPKTAEFQVVRTSLLPGILNTIDNNQHKSLPMRLFEIQDIVVTKDGAETGATNERRLCAVHYGMEPEFESMVDVLYSVMSSLGYVYEEHRRNEENDGDSAVRAAQTYSIHNESLPYLMETRSFSVTVTSAAEYSRGRRVIGSMGIIRPSVLRNYHIKKGMATVLEIEVESFL